MSKRMYILIALAVPVLFFLVAFIIGGKLSAPGYKGPKSDHFDGKKFLNTGGAQSKGLLDVMRWMISRDHGPWTKNYETAVGEKPAAATEAAAAAPKIGAKRPPIPVLAKPAETAPKVL